MSSPVDEKVERTILINSVEWGIFRITIPRTYQITFGKQQPGESRFSEDGTKAPTLRIYDGTASSKKQVCAFPGVLAFRDTSLPVEFMDIDGTWHETDGKEFIAAKAMQALRKTG